VFGNWYLSDSKEVWGFSDTAVLTANVSDNGTADGNKDLPYDVAASASS
jgi:hypothetical protein